MTSVRPVELASDTASAQRSRAERSKLRRELGRLDAICLLIAAIVVLDTLGAVAKGGAQTLVSLISFVETPVWVGGSAAITCVAVGGRRGAAQPGP